MMKLIIKKHLAILPVLLAALAMFPAPAQAQQESPAQTQQIALSDNQISAFSKAHIQVEQINQTYQQQLAAVADPQEQQKIVEEANEKMIAIIEANGLNVELYNAIVHQIPDNPELKSRVTEEIQRRQSA